MLGEMSIYTPVNVDILETMLHGYGDKEFLSQGFRNGFSLGIRPDFPFHKSVPRQTKSNNPELIAKLNKEVLDGHIVGPFNEPPFQQSMVISPVMTIPKPNGKHRMIFNLSHKSPYSVNDSIPASHKTVAYCTIQQVANYILHSNSGPVYLVKIDLANAYRMVPIAKAEWRHLCMKVEGKYLVDRCLPMGAGSSCQIFQRISDGIKWAFTNTLREHIKVFNYLDDFLLLAKTQQIATIARNHFENLTQQLGVPVSHDKTVGPTQTLNFLGIGIDTREQTLFLTAEKTSQAREMVHRFLLKKQHKVAKWQSMLGTLCHISQVVTAGRAHMSSLYESLAGLLSIDKHTIRKISSSSRQELEVWVNFLSTGACNKKFKMLNSSNMERYEHTIFTDASGSIGFGGFFGSKWFYGTWNDNFWKKKSIAVLELYPIFLAIQLFSSIFSDRVVLVCTDNMAVMRVLNKLYTPDPYMSPMVKKVALTCMQNNIFIHAKHVPGAKNTLADMLSRQRVDLFKLNSEGMDISPTTIPQHLIPEAVKKLLPKC